MKIDFQKILLSIFIIGLGLGVALFAGIIPSGGGSEGASGLSVDIVIWGPLDAGVLTAYLGPIEDENDNLSITYVQKEISQINAELSDAIAAGRGPDLFFMSDDYILRHSDKVVVIPYDSFPRLEFQEAYIDQGGMFMNAEGIVAFPFAVDPLVLYYNRDLLSSAFIVNPPVTWQELAEITPQLTVRTESGVIQQAAISLGTYDNIPHAKSILSTLAIQAGSPMVIIDAKGRYKEALASSGAQGGMTSALRYYTSFAQPRNEQYTWSVNMRSARDTFIAEESAMYIGYASELQSLRTQNPNLNFNVSLLPQLEGQQRKMVGARIFGLAISGQSENVGASYQLAQRLTSPDYVFEFSQILQLPPVRREVLASTPPKPHMRVFYNSALIAGGWLDPESMETSRIFETMIENVLAGLATPGEAVRRANSDVAQLLPSR